MKRQRLFRRLSAALLALILAASLVPAALAAVSCPQCGGEVLCTDNGDGRTHTLRCPVDGYTDGAAAHTFVDGRCSLCGAMDYSQVRIVLPTGAAFTAALHDSGAAVSLEGVKLTLGTEDVTEAYTLSYSWYYDGDPVGTGQRCALPAAVIGREGDYELVCFVTAVPGNALAGKTISASCTVTRHDCLAVLSALQEQIIYALQEGKRISLGDIGRFRVMAIGAGSDTAESYDTNLIKRLKVCFTPNTRLKDALTLDNKAFPLTRLNLVEEEEDETEEGQI